jgi:hypothetical protein
MGIFTYKIVLQNIPFNKMLRTRNEDFKFQRGQWDDPAEIDQELINCLLKGTVCVAFRLPYFRQSQ